MGNYTAFTIHIQLLFLFSRRFQVDIKQDFENGSIVGYAWAFFSTIGWYIQSKWQRKLMTNELRRISAERNELQTKIIGEKYIKSSEEL